MRPHEPQQFGDLVVAAFDLAAQRSANPREVTRIALRSLDRVVWRARRGSCGTVRRSMICAARGGP
ncbi:MAG: hypothetical protein IPI49_17815 [Myxococcales bacterium]|nr:hypothetical protein [Myxococcales bacterium]